MKAESTNKNEKTLTEPQGSGSAVGLGVTPTGKGEWNIEQSATYRCVRCGDTMLSLVKRSEDGKIVIKEIPLLCKSCATHNEFRIAARVIMKHAKDFEDLIRLFEQLETLKGESA
jgi:DNA-directed RNA polymerase subunit RPC12/RpoP